MKPVPADVLASLLPEFPSVSVLDLGPETSAHHVAQFLTLYNKFAHQVLQVIVKATFTEVEPLLLTFWGNLSDDVLTALDNISDIICYCDLLLFKVCYVFHFPFSASGCLAAPTSSEHTENQIGV